MHLARANRRSLAVAVRLLAVTAACGVDASCVGRTSSPATGAVSVAPRAPIVRGIDHFFATSPEPEPLYRVFRDSLGLPEVYPFRNYGSFASGVVSMGNVMFEVVTWAVSPGDTLRTEFKGIAFEPSERLPLTLARLRERGLAFQALDSMTYTTPDGLKALGYINVPLDGPGGLPPASASIFINDNLGNPRAAARRQEGADELARRDGGPLGVLGVRELVVGVERRDAALAHWRRLLESPAQESGGLITLPAGPAVRFVEAPAGAILEMVVRVRSLEHAARFLAGRSMLREEGGQLLIAPAAVGGLRIRLLQ